MRGREESAGSAREEESAGGARGADQSAGAQEAPELRRSEREVSAQEEQAEQEREAEAQGGHESEVKAQEGHKGKVKAQGEQGEDANSVHEESHVSNRHMTWWQNAWWVRVNNGPHLRTARDGEQPQEPRRKCVRQERSPGEKERNGRREAKKATSCTSSFTFLLQALQQQNQQQQQQQRWCACSDPPDRVRREGDG